MISQTAVYANLKAKRTLKLGLDETIAELSLCHKADQTQAGWEITEAKETYNIAVSNGGMKGAAGVTQKSPMAGLQSRSSCRHESQCLFISKISAEHLWQWPASR